MAKPIRVFLADDHVAMRSGLRMLLEGEADITVVGEASDGEGALEQIESLRAQSALDVAVLDVGMPTMSGLEALRRLKRRDHALPVLILTMHASESYMFQAIQAGASGYLVKNADPHAITDAIRDVFSGHAFVSPAVEGRVLAELVSRARRAGARATSALQSLTEREREVLGLIALGHTNVEIGEKLFVTVKTVETHRAHIMTKLGLRTRADLVRYALREGYLTEADASSA
jgi:two-component system response regulator NreC